MMPGLSAGTFWGPSLVSEALLLSEQSSFSFKNWICKSDFQPTMHGCATIHFVIAGASANCCSPARAILFPINTPIIRKSPQVNWNIRHVCLLHGQPGNMNCLEKSRLPHLSAKAKSEDHNLKPSLTISLLPFQKEFMWNCCCYKMSSWRQKVMWVTSLLSCLMVRVEESLHLRAKVSSSFIQGEKSTRRTNLLSAPLSCVHGIPVFYVTALFMSTFD